LVVGELGLAIAGAVIELPGLPGATDVSGGIEAISPLADAPALAAAFVAGVAGGSAVVHAATRISAPIHDNATGNF
jgi:hypothetical protein